ncbi:MAG: bifunctional (p)ppGpp synthetase/guanosine-3',5'-bis(diphosphate) 3'-pyrophosphohydrolase [Sterolibacterium sp.]|nr:bifunctional (p)ppGpp synthetase/guanosine-3',5'-bis(diphosphate) 3'-pyrophosphohydrolase [Sterolibacterium sp.]
MPPASDPSPPPAVSLQEGPPARAAAVAATPELTLALNTLLGKLAIYLEPEEIDRIEEAYHFGAAAHESQFRSTGEPYISHPLAVATTLADWHLDSQALMAALLHDVVEDTPVNKEDVAERFGKQTAELVDAVSKIGRLEGQSYEEAQAENFRKMLLAMARDVRVILIKLADRLHNIQTLGTFRPDKRRRVARETLDIYAPIANRLGLNTLSRELQELSFLNAQPMRYRVLEKALKNARGNRREGVNRITETLRRQLPEMGIEAEVMGREKHIYSIYRKMREKNLSFSQVYDIYGFRILVKDQPSCYLALGALHSIYKPVPGKIKDYIAIPKANGYQSLHTTLIGPYGTPVEIQIRTHEMHHIAESGVASHWMYKDEQTLSEFQQKTHKWLQSLLDLQTTSGTSSEFLEHVKVDLFPGEVFVFTPQGKIIGLPRGATPVDFAYAVHTDIGNRCVACRINGELKPLRTELRNGEQVEIICAAHPNPNPGWLSYVKSSRARSQIRHFLKSRQSDESAELGSHLLGQALRAFDLALDAIDETTWERFARNSGTQNKKEILTDIGLGKRLAAIVARRLVSEHESATGNADLPAENRKPLGPILIHGAEGIVVQLAKCCRPLPGDAIIGIVHKGQGLTVHTNDCRSISRARNETGNWVEVEWDPASSGSYETCVRIVAENRRGALARMTTAIAAADSDIINLQIDDDPDVCTTLLFTLRVNNRIHLARIMRSLRHLPEVVRISRVRD